MHRSKLLLRTVVCTPCFACWVVDHKNKCTAAGPVLHFDDHQLTRGVSDDRACRQCGRQRLCCIVAHVRMSRMLTHAWGRWAADSSSGEDASRAGGLRVVLQSDMQMVALAPANVAAADVTCCYEQGPGCVVMVLWLGGCQHRAPGPGGGGG